MAKIAALRALEILDSRGNPTVRVHMALDDGTTVSIVGAIGRIYRRT